MRQGFVVDQERFDSVTKRRDPNYYRVLFFDQAEQALLKLETLLETNAIDLWHETIHKLKGAAATLGFASTTQLLESMQDCGAETKEDKMHNLMRIRLELETIETFFRMSDRGERT